MPQLHLKTASIRALIWLVAIGCLLQTGCVRRRLMVRSNPPGAMVYVDNQPIGTTPCATDFVYYGTREIRLVKAGYETLTVNQPLPAPWYQIPPFDFVSENIVPNKIQDYRTTAYTLTPQVIVPTAQLIARGEQLRQSTLQGAVVPANTTTPLPVIPSGSTLGQPIFVPPTTGQLTPGQLTPGQPTLGLPTLAPPNPNVLPPNTLTPPTNVLPPGSSASPIAPGTNAIPIGSQFQETLPPPRP